jgi:site-specific DNA-methyltransferase (adenine-specific)
MLNQITLGDCNQLLKEINPNSVEAVITDPPYGTASKSKVSKVGNNLVEFNLEWDAELPLEWIEAAAGALKPGGSFIVFTDNLSVNTVWCKLKDCGLTPLQTIYWKKVNPPPQPRKNFCSAIETAVFARKSGKLLCWNGGGITHNVFEYPIVTGPDRTPHPTQKPMQLMQKLISLVTKPGDTVLDPFVGSGTTAHAAYNLDRNFIAFEKDPAYWAIANERFENAKQQIKAPLFIFENEEQQRMAI